MRHSMGFVFVVMGLMGGCARSARPIRYVEPKPCPADASRNAPGCIVRVRLELLSADDAPHYPPVLRSAGVAGQVDVEFEVLGNGAVDSASIRVVRSTNAMFVPPTIASIAKWHFTREMVAHAGPVRFGVALRYAQMVETCAVANNSPMVTWNASGDFPMMTVMVCQRPLIARDQLTPTGYTRTP